MKKTIEMFNPLVIRSSQDYIREFKKYRLQIIVNFQNLSLYRPEIHENNGATKLMFPNDARLRNFTYNSNMTLDLEINYIINKETTWKLKKSKPRSKQNPIWKNSNYVEILHLYFESI